mmetsp:Transcript_19429/g.45208  ORF Transcript_19429/g.45208 Transcript_19429/m.45208 type:complete len:379 (+) Transcript_19429:1217-2353(+)
MPRAMVNYLQVQVAHALHNGHHESPGGIGLGLDTEKHGSSRSDALSQIILALVAALFHVVLTQGLHLGGSTHFSLRPSVVVRNRKAQQKGWNDSREQHRQDNAGIELLANQTTVHTKDGNDKGEFSLGSHRKTRDETITHVRARETLCVGKVGDQKAGSQLADESERQKEPLPDNLEAAKLFDGYLESDTRSKKNAHEPLQKTLELSNKGVMETVGSAKGQSGYKGTHEVTRFSVVCGGHETDEHQKHDSQLDLAMELFGDPGENMLFENGWQDKDRHGTSHKQKQKGRHHGNQYALSRNGSRQCLQLREHHQCNHIINHRCCHNQLSDGCVENSTRFQNVEGNSKGGGTETSTGSNGTLRFLTQGKGEGDADSDGED